MLQIQKWVRNTSKKKISRKKHTCGKLANEQIPTMLLWYAKSRTSFPDWVVGDSVILFLKNISRYWQAEFVPLGDSSPEPLK